MGGHPSQIYKSEQLLCHSDGCRQRNLLPVARVAFFEKRTLLLVRTSFLTIFFFKTSKVWHCFRLFKDLFNSHTVRHCMTSFRYRCTYNFDRFSDCFDISHESFEIQSVKGTIAWDFCTLVFFSNRPHSGHLFTFLNIFRIWIQIRRVIRIRNSYCAMGHCGEPNFFCRYQRFKTWMV